MAKTKAPGKPKATVSEPNEVVVTYDLFSLPTAFHKAGLAGLVLLIESLKERKALKAEDARYIVTSTTVTVTYTEALVRQLLDDVYDAVIVEVAVAKKWDAPIVRKATPDELASGKPFIHHQLQPKGAFFDNTFDGDKEIWRRLWRQAIWEVLRPRDKNRIPYQERNDGIPCNEGRKAWADLLGVLKSREDGRIRTSVLSSALIPGLQEENAERSPCEDVAEFKLLLHFWPLVVLLFSPQQLKVKKGGGELQIKYETVGYTLAIPEVSNLSAFVEQYPKLLAGLSKKVRGFRPAQAVIDIAAEGSLAFLDRLAQVAGVKVEDSQVRYSISSVEYLHIVKEGNNIKTMAAGRVSPIKNLLAGYRELIAPSSSKVPLYRNPLFRRGLLMALLEGLDWFQPFLKTLCSFDADVFIRPLRRTADDDQSGPPQFASDAARKLRDETQKFMSSLERMKAMPEAERPKPVAPPAVIVNRVVRNYLLLRAKDKSGIDPEQFKTPEGEIDYKAIPGEFNEVKNKLALGLMLEFRSRKEQAFVDHFASVFFSVTQRLAEQDRLALAELLVSNDNRDDLKTLTLLSLSANS